MDRYTEEVASRAFIRQFRLLGPAQLTSATVLAARDLNRLKQARHLFTIRSFGSPRLYLVLQPQEHGAVFLLLVAIRVQVGMRGGKPRVIARIDRTSLCVNRLGADRRRFRVQECESPSFAP